MCVSPFNQPHPLSLSSMLRVVPIQPTVSFLWLNGDNTHKHGLQRKGLAEWGSHTYMSERMVCNLPFVIHGFMSFIILTHCLFNMWCMWRPFNQPYPSSVWMKDTHTHNMGTDRRIQLADWGLHTCMPERRVFTLPFAIYMLEPPFTSHTPCLFYPCCVWRTFNSRTPPCLNDGLTHTHTKHGWQKGTGGWFAHVYDKKRVCTFPFVIDIFSIPFTGHTPCLSHPCCVWYPFNQP